MNKKQERFVVILVITQNQCIRIFFNMFKLELSLSAVIIMFLSLKFSLKGVEIILKFATKTLLLLPTDILNIR